MTADRSDRRSQAFTAASVPDNYQRRLAPVIFEPWAEALVETAGVRAGDRVLDVASGTGVVARIAAHRAGPRGRVVASDVSAPMLTHSATLAPPANSAAIEYREAKATDLPFADGSFDFVLCQQGLQFVAERLDAAREMLRVLRGGGVAAVSVWAAGFRLEPFDAYAEALAGAGVEPPFPRAFENATFVMSADRIRSLFEDAGFAAVDVSLVERTIEWPDAEAAVRGILGTPFGPVVDALPADQRQALDADLTRRFAPEASGAPVRRTTASVVVRATTASD